MILFLLGLESFDVITAIELNHAEQMFDLQRSKISINGDFILGGLFTIHGTCLGQTEHENPLSEDKFDISQRSVPKAQRTLSEEANVKVQISKAKCCLSCTKSISKGAFHVVVAMLSAVKEINKNNNLLPGITLGLEVKDTCGSVDNAIRQFLDFNFVKSYLKEIRSCSSNHDSTMLSWQDNMSREFSC